MARRKVDRTAAEQIEWMRNLLAFMLVGAFIAGGGMMFLISIPDQNKELVSYMTGQLSGMAIMALGFYFVDKVGQAAVDAQKSENTSKLADAVNKALSAGSGDDAVAHAAEETAEAAVDKAKEIKGDM